MKNTTNAAADAGTLYCQIRTELDALRVDASLARYRGKRDAQRDARIRELEVKAAEAWRAHTAERDAMYARWQAEAMACEAAA